MDNWQHLFDAHASVRETGRSAVPNHTPIAAVLSCSDARVPPSVIFDQGAGQLFVVRVAGNSATPAAIASIDYAVEELDVPLVIVLGHTSCGAVGAACAGSAAAYLEPLTRQISPLIGTHGCPDVDGLAVCNVLAGVRTLTDSPTPTGQAIRSGNVIVQGAIYDVATDTLRDVSETTTTPLLPSHS